MIPMLLEGFVVSSARHAKIRVAGALALLAALVVAPIARAETGSSLPQGYASDMDAPAQDDATAPADVAPQPADAAPQPADAAPQAATPQPATDTGASDGAEAEYTDTDPSALSDFREPLSPYGVWVDDPTYGTIWVPNAGVVGPDFTPYQTAGHWTLDDDDEWLWVSDYDWGYIPFHYGRWIWVPGRGWAWIPGREYAPAWVVWRTGDYGYIGWAPMPPAYYWSGGVAVGFWTPIPAVYVFCPTTYVFAPHVTTYVVHDRTVVRTAVAHTTPYRPAHPHMGGGAHSPGAAHAYHPASPSLQAAGVPRSAAPKSRAKPDSRALAYAHRSRGGAAGRGISAGPTQHASWAARHGISRPESRAMIGDLRSRGPEGRTFGRGFDGGRAFDPGRGRGLEPGRGFGSRGVDRVPSAASPRWSAPSRSFPASRSPRFGGGGIRPPSSRVAPPAYHPSISPRFGGGGFRGGLPSSSSSTHRSFRPPVRSMPTFHGGGRGGGRGGRHR